MHSNDWTVLIDCNNIGRDFYLSNFLFKLRFSTVHGPCLTDEAGLIDFAYCLHCKLWIAPAKQWVTRWTNNSWPRCDVKKTIVKHGVLFVPVGVKGSTQEEFDRRVSFSVGEKLLIYSFSHSYYIIIMLCSHKNSSKRLYSFIGRL